MAWVKIPKEHHPLFLAVMPTDPGVEALRMFGGIAATVNGNMAGGLFARSMIVRLNEDDQKRALALEGAVPFDPMGNGRVMKDTVMLPEDIMEKPDEMRAWLERAVAFTRTLPPKQKKAKPAAKRPAAKPAAKKPAAKKPAAKKPAAKPAARKPAAKKAAASTKKRARPAKKSARPAKKSAKPATKSAKPAQKRR